MNCFLFLFFSVINFLLFLPVQGNEIKSTFSGNTFEIIEKISAVVNEDVITYSELRDELIKEYTPNIFLENNIDVINQTLEKMIINTLEQQEAKKLGICISEFQIHEAMNTVAMYNGITLDGLYDELEKSGLSIESYRKTLRNELIRNELKKCIIDPIILITDKEIDDFLPVFERIYIKKDLLIGISNSTMFSPRSDQFYTLAQIVIPIPDACSKSKEELIRKKVQFLIKKINEGTDFHTIETSTSDGIDIFNEGILGTKSLNEWPDLFIESIQNENLKSGQISNILRSKDSFHIIKVINSFSKSSSRKLVSNPSWVVSQFPEKKIHPEKAYSKQTYIKHILIKYSGILNQENDKQYIELIRSKIESGSDSFENMAFKFSQDYSAYDGGDIGWIVPGQLPKVLEEVVDSLESGSLSEAIISPIGIHLIKVQERRIQDVSKIHMRDLAHQVLWEKYSQFAFDEWVKNLRRTAFIEVQF